jgi:tetratricopeptide (TPR) repeat protein
MNLRTLSATLLFSLAASCASAGGVADKLRECRTGKGDAAVAACTQYLGAGNLSDKENAFAHMLRAQAYIDQQKYQQAFDDYAAATEAQPRDADTWFNHAVLAARLSRLDVAVADLTQAIALRPGWAQAYVARGAMYLALRENRKALDDDTKALTLEPANPDALADKARAQERLAHPH